MWQPNYRNVAGTDSAAHTAKGGTVLVIHGNQAQLSPGSHRAAELLTQDWERLTYQNTSPDMPWQVQILFQSHPRDVISFLWPSYSKHLGFSVHA